MTLRQVQVSPFLPPLSRRVNICPWLFPVWRQGILAEVASSAMISYLDNLCFQKLSLVYLFVQSQRFCTNMNRGLLPIHHPEGTTQNIEHRLLSRKMHCNPPQKPFCHQCRYSNRCHNKKCLFLCSILEKRRGISQNGENPKVARHRTWFFTTIILMGARLVPTPGAIVFTAD